MTEKISLPMTCKLLKINLLLGIISLFTLCGITEAKEPISAPAEQGAIHSPRLITKSRRSKNFDLLKLVKEAVEISERRYLVANEHSPWQIYHGMNAFRRDFKIEKDGEVVRAIDWISKTNPQFRDLPWFQKTVHGGRAHKYTVPYHFEGHPNQSLALMVMSNLPTDFEFKVDHGTITIADIIHNAKMNIDPREELTWTLWFLTHYVDTEETWTTRLGETWSIEKLVGDQVKTKVTKSACGGSHNLYSLAVSRNNHLRDGGQLRGVWVQADQKLKRYMMAARSLQRRDGSFPTHYFRGYGSPKSFSEQISSSGHMMEWLMVAASDRQMDDEWIERGIYYLAKKLIDNRDQSAECGPLYHAVSALNIYRDRINGVAWPDPKIQPTASVQQKEVVEKEPKIEAIPRSLPQTGKEKKIPRLAIRPQADQFQFPVTKKMDEKKNSKKKETEPESVAEQSTQGKLAIGIDTPEAEAENKVEILAAPVDDTPVK